MSTILGPNGEPIVSSTNGARVTTHAQTRDGLPGWVHSVGYRADDDVITLRVIVPDSTMARAHILALESTPEDLRTLVDVLQQCLTRSAEAMRVLEVQPAESSD